MQDASGFPCYWPRPCEGPCQLPCSAALLVTRCVTSGFSGQSRRSDKVPSHYQAVRRCLQTTPRDIEWPLRISAKGASRPTAAARVSTANVCLTSDCGRSPPRDEFCHEARSQTIGKRPLYGVPSVMTGKARAAAPNTQPKLIPDVAVDVDSLDILEVLSCSAKKTGSKWRATQKACLRILIRALVLYRS